MNTEELLFYIVKKVGLFGKLRTSTNEISKEFDVSQQTISRKLRELENEKVIEREVSPLGVVIRLKQRGVSIMKDRYSFLRRVFGKRISFSGIVKKSFGEGAYYVKIYSKKFKNKLGFKPFLGTLNLKVNPAKSKEFILNSVDRFVDGFSDDSRTFGGVHCYEAKINDEVDGALVVPVRARHPNDIVELIAPISLRKRFSLKDGDKVIIGER